MGIFQRGVQERAGQENPPNKCSTQDAVILPKLCPVEHNSQGMGIRDCQGYEHILSTFLRLIPGFIPIFVTFPHMWTICPQPSFAQSPLFPSLTPDAAKRSQTHRQGPASVRLISLW